MCGEESMEESYYYIVAPYNTLYGISDFFNIDISMLMQYNPGLSPSQMLIGQLIRIPMNAPEARGITEGTVYNVQPGDTVANISDRFLMNAQEIAHINPVLKTGLLYVGQNLLIPIQWGLYFDQTLNISFRYPTNWKREISDSGEKVRFTGGDGFFAVDLVAANPDKSVDIKSIEEVGKSVALKKSELYGREPVIEKCECGGQIACLIHSNKKESGIKQSFGALVVKYPRLFYIGGIPYAYVVLCSGGRYLSRIRESLAFISR
jgi:LysM repeat protein